MPRFVTALAGSLLSLAATADDVQAPQTVAELGKALYFDVNLSKNRTQSCATCHSPQFGFADPRRNASGRAVSLGDDGVSLGDRNAPTASYAALTPRFHRTADGRYVGGKFKVPTLRNVAVTGPYMHNGVFEDLRTVVLFYNKYNSKRSKRQINPETGEKWREPEIGENLSIKELEHGPALENRRIDALVAFMKTLTDRRYEHLLEGDATPSLSQSAEHVLP